MNAHGTSTFRVTCIFQLFFGGILFRILTMTNGEQGDPSLTTISSSSLLQNQRSHSTSRGTISLSLEEEQRSRTISSESRMISFVSEMIGGGGTTISLSASPVKKTKTCRMSNDIRLDEETFASYTCGLCFYYSFLQTSRTYKRNYMIQRCPAGSLICDLRHLRQLYLLERSQQKTMTMDNSDHSIDNSSSSPIDKIINSDAANDNADDYYQELAYYESVCNCERLDKIYNLHEFNNYTVPLEHLRMEPSLPYGFVKMTRDCCEEARRCCHDMILLQNDNINSTSHNNETGSDSFIKKCPRTWDGWQCWHEAEPGTNARGVCPYYSYGMTSISSTPNPNEYYSMKTCLYDGHWWTINRSQQQQQVEWTDYRKCATARIYEESTKHIVGICAFAISVVAIIPAVIIFSSYRSLKVDRIAIHKHLLVSFLFTGVLFIFNNIFYVADDAYGASLVETNHVSCRVLFLIQLRYLRISNYMWMLCEGLYLYKFLIDAFFESRSLVIYYLLGWVFPFVPTVIYAILRLQLDDEKCWMAPNIGWIEWITYGPCILSLALNFFLMISILRILITKLRHTPANEPAQYRKAVRATLVLLPVFGLHFFLTIYKLVHIFWYEILNKLLDGLQGFIVAIIICYTHGEILELLRKTWQTHKMRKNCEREARRSKKLYDSGGDCGHSLL